MKKKINRGFVAVAFLAIGMTLAVMTVIFYSRLKAQVFSDLQVYVKLLADRTDYEELPEEIRVTVIDEDGDVSYDSVADAMTLENHSNRPEVKKALEQGFGQGIRTSDTLSKSVFYYAIRLENGQVLRVGKEAASVVWLFLSAIPIAALMAVVLAVVCMVASHYLTAAIVAPIDVMVEDMDYAEENRVYEELVPFIRKIRSQHEEILSAANMRQEFTANVSHELKTPLAAILGYAELMESGMAKEGDVQHFSHEIGKSASRLLSLINDIIKLSRLDGGYREEVLEVVDLAVIAGDTVEMLSLHATDMGVDISYQGCTSAGVRLGRELAEELTYNLIENAIRYNRPGGKVEVCVTQEGQGVSFSVSDTGIGIPREHQERIFERFYRVDKSRSKELGGTGLGLAIVKHICTLTGGTLLLESQEGQGTRITVTWDDSFG